MADKLVIAKHNIDDSPNTPTKYGVRGIPTMLLFSGGQLIDTKVGAANKSNIKEWLDSKVR
jgi:thioredoxin 1